MEELLKIMKDGAIRSSPLLLFLLVIGYFGKVYIENQMDVIHTEMQSISSTSLSIKESLRSKELDALLELRDNIEDWQHKLQSSLTDFSNNKVSSDSINQFYKEESILQLGVKKSIAKLGILTQNEDIYYEGQTALIDISKLYTPYIGKYLPQIIDLQAESEPINKRMVQREKQMANYTLSDAEGKIVLEQAKSDQVKNRDIQARSVKLMREASDELIQAYPKIVNVLTDLKISMNSHVYRSLKTVNIDERQN